MASIAERMREGLRPIVGEEAAGRVAASFEKLEKEAIGATAGQLLVLRKPAGQRSDQDQIIEKSRVMWERIGNLARRLNPDEPNLSRAIYDHICRNLKSSSDEELKEIESGRKSVDIGG
jgi:hypothetical protein